MKSKNQDAGTFLRVSLLLLLSLPLPRGRATGVVPLWNAHVVSSEKAALDALWNLKDGQTLRLNVSEIRLQATVTIDAVNVSIYGSGGKTRIRCPNDGGAFSIRFVHSGALTSPGGVLWRRSGGRVLLSGLEFSGCKTRSALNVTGISTALATARRNKLGCRSGMYADEHRRSRVYVRNCTFRGNAAGRGAAIVVRGSRLVVKDTTFAKNVANTTGGALYAYCSAVTVKGSRFTGNKAKRGGAISIEESQTLVVKGSTFERDRASDDDGDVGGGAVHAVDCHTVVTLRNSTFSSNKGESNGGAIHASGGSSLRLCGVRFQDNEAVRGGAVSVTNSAKIKGLEGCRNSTFQGNAAFRGGGLFCHRCAARLDSNGSHPDHTPFLFSNNTAVESGGGVHVAESGDRSSIANAIFSNNVASFGGGMALRDCFFIQLESINFAENLAVEGGGLHIISEFGRVGIYKVHDLNLTKNHARNIKGMESAAQHVAVARWIEARKNALSKGVPDWLEGEDRRRGKGGACYIALRNRHGDSFSVNLAFSSAFVRHNSANIGGGIYVENNGHVIKRGRCQDKALVQKPCLSVRFRNVTIVSNYASSAGGGFFVSRPKRLRDYGFMEGRPFKFRWCKGDGGFDGRFCFYGNRISAKDDAGVGYGPQRATDAWSLEVENACETEPEFYAGDKLTAGCSADETLAGDISLVVTDGLNQSVKGMTEDSEMAVVLRSKYIAGTQRYTADNGIIELSDTYLVGYSISDTIEIQSDDDRNIRKELKFATRPGARQEGRTVYQHKLRNCPSGTYTLSDGDESCAPCDSRAICDGTAKLVPFDGYWHSSPFSPFIRRCPNKEACSYETRTETLEQYYKRDDISDDMGCAEGLPQDLIRACSVRSYKQWYHFAAVPIYEYSYEYFYHTYDSDRYYSGYREEYSGDKYRYGYRYRYSYDYEYEQAYRKRYGKGYKHEGSRRYGTGYLDVYGHDYNVSDGYIGSGEWVGWFGMYKQCAPGYRGILCGNCMDMHGHAANGECKFCNQSLPTARVLTALSLFVVFLMISGKVWVGIDGVWKLVTCCLDAERRSIMATISQDQPTNPQSSGHEDGHSGVAEMSAGTTEASMSQTRNEAPVPNDEGTSISPVTTPPSLERSTAHIEDPTAAGGSEENRSPSAAISIASGLQVATLNILFNYVQLSTVALSLDVDWGAALKQLFILNGRLARMMRVELLPFDCSFGDRGYDHGVPSAVWVLWFRIGFPIMEVAVYVMVVVLFKLFRGERRISRFKADILPSVTLISLIVYLAYCIDIMSDLFKFLDCLDLSSDYSDKHPYHQYEAMYLDRVWMEDTGVHCWQGPHLVSALLAGIGIFVCLLLIVLMVVVLYRASSKNKLKDPKFLRRFGILRIGYRSDGIALYWEVVLTLRRIALAGVEVYSSHRETSGVQIGLLAIVIFTSLALHDIVQPFEEEFSEEAFPAYAGSEVRLIVPQNVRNRWVAFNRSVTLNGLEGAALFMSLSLFLVAGCICDDKAKNVETTVLLVVCFFLNGVYFLFMIYRLWYGFHHYVDALADDKGLRFTTALDQEKDKETYLFIKVWKLLRFKPVENDNADSAEDNA